MQRGGADERSRTPDLRITNALLYQLSYIGLLKTQKFNSDPSAWEIAHFLPRQEAF